MEYSSYININDLAEEAKKELKLFYEYLLYKYKQPKQREEDNNKTNTMNKKFKAISIDTKGFKFNREEANER